MPSRAQCISPTPPTRATEAPISDAFTDLSLVDRSADEFADGEEITVNELPKDAAVAICTLATNQESK